MQYDDICPVAGHILRAPNHDPLGQVSYQQNSAEPKHIGKRRVGRPRQHWVFKSNEDIHALHIVILNMMEIIFRMTLF